MELPKELIKFFFSKEPEKQVILEFADVENEKVKALMDSASWDIDFLSMEGSLNDLLKNETLRRIFGGTGASVTILM